MFVCRIIVVRIVVSYGTYRRLNNIVVRIVVSYRCYYYCGLQVSCSLNIEVFEVVLSLVALLVLSVVCVCVYICIYMYAYIYIYIHTHTHTHTYTYVHIYIYMYILYVCIDILSYTYTIDLPHQALVRLVLLRHHQEARGAAVDAVHNA